MAISDELNQSVAFGQATLFSNYINHNDTKEADKILKEEKYSAKNLCALIIIEAINLESLEQHTLLYLFLALKIPIPSNSNGIESRAAHTINHIQSSEQAKNEYKNILYDYTRSKLTEQPSNNFKVITDKLNKSFSELKKKLRLHI